MVLRAGLSFLFVGYHCSFFGIFSNNGDATLRIATGFFTLRLMQVDSE